MKNLHETETEGFDIPEKASQPTQPRSAKGRPATKPANDDALARVTIKSPEPELPIIEPAPPRNEVPWTAHADLRSAFGEVQRLQRAFDAAPNQSRQEQRHRWQIGQSLEQAKNHAFQVQQGAVPPSISEAATAMIRIPPIARVKTLRQTILESLKN